MEKIQTILSIYYDVAAIKAVVNTILRQPQLKHDIVVVENPSEYTEETIRPFIMGLMEKGHVTHYFLTDRNITHNATRRVLLDEKIDVLKTQKILVTNGNLSCKDDTWLPKQIKILNNNKSIFTCAVPISMANCPKGNERAILPMHSTAHKEYDIGFGGKHMLLMRSNEFKDFINSELKTKPFIDATMHHFSRRKAKTWVMLKDPKFHRHTWDLMNRAPGEPKDPYIERKGRHLLKGFWNHEQYCSYTMYTPNNKPKRTEIEDKKTKVFE